MASSECETFNYISFTLRGIKTYCLNDHLADIRLIHARLTDSVALALLASATGAA
jgi:hypothetical protein